MGMHKYRHQHGEGSSGLMPQIKNVIGALMRAQATRADCRSLLTYLREKGEQFHESDWPHSQEAGRKERILR